MRARSGEEPSQKSRVPRETAARREESLSFPRKRESRADCKALDARFRGHDRRGWLILRAHAPPWPRAASSPARLLRAVTVLGWSGPRLALENRERAAHQRLGLGEAVRGLKQCARLLRSDRHIGMIGAVALLVDRQRTAHERLGLGEAVRGLKQHREIVEVGSPHWDDPGRSSSRRSRARGASSGSASARRFVARSSCARLLRSNRHIGMIRAIALLVDRERAAHQRLGLGEAVRVLKQLREIVEVGSPHWDDPGRSSVSSIASARRISGSASARRFVS